VAAVERTVPGLARFMKVRLWPLPFPSILLRLAVMQAHLASLKGYKAAVKRSGPSRGA
jgi:hypothetical protein